MAMFLLIPVALALGHTSAAGGKVPDFNNNFDLFNLLGRHLYGTTPTIRSGNLPNLYCGILSVILLPIFATMKAIPRRRRVVYMGLWAAMGISMVINVFDLAWHGNHSPNDLPYRFSFLYCFVLLLIAYEVLTRVRLDHLSADRRFLRGHCGLFDAGRTLRRRCVWFPLHLYQLAAAASAVRRAAGCGFPLAKHGPARLLSDFVGGGAGNVHWGRLHPAHPAQQRDLHRSQGLCG